MDNHDYTIAQQEITLVEHARRITRLEDSMREQTQALANINAILTEIRTEMKVRNEISGHVRTMVWAIVMLILSQIGDIVMEALK